MLLSLKNQSLNWGNGMAEAEPENNEIKQRAVRRLLVAVVLVLVAVGILTYLSYYKPAKVVTKPTPDTVPPPPPPIVTGPEPIQPAPSGEALPELPPLPTPAETLPPAVPDTTPPPPPPSVTSKPLPPPGPGPKKTPAPTAQKPLVPAQNVPAPSAKPTETPAPTAAAPKPVTPPAGYVVQFGVFGNPQNALQLVKKLKQAGIEAHTETRVQLPAFKTKAEAEAALAKMREKGITATIVAR
jgi:DedD protein